MLKVERFIFGPFETNCYVVCDKENILIIDPACSNEYEQKVLLDYTENQKSKITNPKLSLIATHGHLDHLWGAKWATEQWQTPVLMHKADVPMAEAMQLQYNLFGIRHKPSAFSIQPISTSPITNLKFEIIHTPGHTPGSICLYFPEDHVLFSGDTLFHNGYGRTDLPGGDRNQLIRSLEHLFFLPGDTQVFPGHGEETVLRYNKSMPIW